MPPLNSEPIVIMCLMRRDSERIINGVVWSWQRAQFALTDIFISQALSNFHCRVNAFTCDKPAEFNLFWLPTAWTLSLALSKPARLFSFCFYVKLDFNIHKTRTWYDIPTFWRWISAFPTVWNYFVALLFLHTYLYYSTFRRSRWKHLPWRHIGVFLLCIASHVCSNMQ